MKMELLNLTPGNLTLEECRCIYFQSLSIKLPGSAKVACDAAQQIIQNILASDEVVYGINTGFGYLANQRIQSDQLCDLQLNLVRSHRCGVGPLLEAPVCRLILALKINALAQGFCGIRYLVVEHLMALLNAECYPAIKSQGSVGASGDLAPLADLAGVLLGEGQAWHKDRLVTAKEALSIAGIAPIRLEAKEGLSLLNGTQVSTGLALEAFFLLERVMGSAIAAGALSVEASRGSRRPFDAQIHAVRRQKGQIQVAAWYRELLDNSGIAESHQNCDKVQDPYSLRCQPQVMGALLDQMQHAIEILIREANAVTDNPLVFPQESENPEPEKNRGYVVSGGNFHAEPVAIVADGLALVIAEIGSLSERRISLLVDPHFSQLPAFLVKDGGVNSGFMIAQVTAAALASENKTWAHPASVDSIPTSANQEDHVSMATFAARRLKNMLMNTSVIIAIECLVAAQGIDFLRPLRASQSLEKLFHIIRNQIPFLDRDRVLSGDIETMQDILLSNQFASIQLKEEKELATFFLGAQKFEDKTEMAACCK